MYVHHPYAQLRRSGYGMRRGVRNIVEFQIKEHLKSTLMQIAHNLRPEQGEHLFTHF
ncbi:hypothetical protein D3C76_1873480 [compost metagenome]